MALSCALLPEVLSTGARAVGDCSEGHDAYPQLHTLAMPCQPRICNERHHMRTCSVQWSLTLTGQHEAMGADALQQSNEIQNGQQQMPERTAARLPRPRYGVLEQQHPCACHPPPEPPHRKRKRCMPRMHTPCTWNPAGGAGMATGGAGGRVGMPEESVDEREPPALLLRRQLRLLLVPRTNVVLLQDIRNALEL